MGLFNFFSSQFVDVIEWLDDSNDTLVYRFDRGNNAIKHGAKLTVRPGQMAVFINQGQLADIFEEGMYELITANLPVLSDLQHWDHGFKSPFQAEVYFFNTRRFGDLKWGTRNPIMLRDPEFGGVRMRAFGTYEIGIDNPETMLRELVGTDGRFTLDEIADRLRNMIVSTFSTALARANIPALELAANYQQLGTHVGRVLAKDFEEIGLALEDFWVENISFPPAVEEALDRRASLDMVGDLSRYFQFQQAEAIGKAAGADNAAGEGLGAGMGLGLGMAAAQSMNAGTPPAFQQPIAHHSNGSTAPPSLPSVDPYHLGIDDQVQGPFELAQIKAMVERGRIDQDTLAWKTGMNDWEPLGDLEDFAPLFSALPPPLT